MQLPAGRTPLQDLIRLLLDCPASEPLRRAIFGTTSFIFDLWSKPWGMARLLGLRGVPPLHHPSASGSTTTNLVAYLHTIPLMLTVKQRSCEYQLFKSFGLTRPARESFFPL